MYLNLSCFGLGAGLGGFGPKPGSTGLVGLFGFGLGAGLGIGLYLVGLGVTGFGAGFGFGAGGSGFGTLVEIHQA